MFLTDFRTQKYTGGIISWVGIFLTITLGTGFDMAFDCPPAAGSTACTYWAD